MASRFQQHVAKWTNCQGCQLCATRKNVVLLRGSLPAPVLFVGEAPGASEDVLRVPFVGPAGKLLDQIVAAAELRPGECAFTNVIACIPLETTDQGTSKVHAPPSFAVEACHDRLVECFGLVQPKAVIWVGKEAAKHGPAALEEYDDSLPTAEILHPAALMRMHISQQQLAFQRCVISISDAMAEIGL